MGTIWTLPRTRGPAQAARRTVDVVNGQPDDGRAQRAALPGRRRARIAPDIRARPVHDPRRNPGRRSAAREAVQGPQRRPVRQHPVSTFAFICNR